MIHQHGCSKIFKSTRASLGFYDFGQHLNELTRHSVTVERKVVISEKPLIRFQKYVGDLKLQG